VSEPLFRTDIQVRFADTDALGHLNNTSFALYVEGARIEFLKHMGATTATLILAHLAIDFRRQVKFGERVFVLTSVEKVGNTSVRLKQDVYADDLLAAEAVSVVVLFDYASNRPQKIPAALRSKLDAHT
jgi:acyl-CoA thioester hydrolase